MKTKVTVKDITETQIVKIGEERTITLELSEREAMLVLLAIGGMSGAAFKDSAHTETMNAGVNGFKFVLQPNEVVGLQAGTPEGVYKMYKDLAGILRK